MAFDQTTRNRLSRFVGDCRGLLTEEFTRQLQSIYGMDPETADVADLESLTLTSTQYETARLLRETLAHYLAGQSKQDKKTCIDVLIRIVREQAFTVLNRLCAIRMAEARELCIECIGKGYQSQGFQLYKTLAGTALGESGDAYRCFLSSLFDQFALDLPVLFDRFSPEGRLFPREAALLEVLGQINHANIDPLWAEDETIGWIYQYFNQKAERDAMRKASRSPRDSREMAVRNQFFTPRYVVEFLTDNTLGRIWYEMTQGKTGLKNSCRYLVRCPNEIFLAEGEQAPEQEEPTEDLTQEELLKHPVQIPFRPLKDPRDIKMLDPACGSMHFGLYAFDLFERIYDESWDLEAERGAEAFARPDRLQPLHETYNNKEAFLRDVPRLIIERNIHGVDIDPRAVQIAGLSLWLRAQKTWQAQDVPVADRPQIVRSNIVCAEAMPGESDMLEEFLKGLRDDRLESLIRRVLEVPENQQIRATARMAEALCDLVHTVWKEMELAGEAGSLLTVEESLAAAVTKGREEWIENAPLFRVMEFGITEEARANPKTMYRKSIPGEEGDFWRRAEVLVLAALEQYAGQAQGAGAARRRMFATDATQGLDFIDTCRRRYDVLLMNPPFGATSRSTKQYLEERYPLTKGDVLANFIERTLALAHDDGLIGAISSRTPFFLGSFESLRTEVLGSSGHVRLMADLGDGVLEAMVETATYVLTPKQPKDRLAIFMRLLVDEDKGPLLEQVIEDCNQCNSSSRLFLIDPANFSQLSGSPYAYWASPATIDTLGNFSPIEGSKASIRVGLQTGDDFRFLRCIWEIDPNLISPSLSRPSSSLSARQQCLDELSSSKSWTPFSKTDAASPWFSPITLCVNWARNGYEIKNFADNKGKIRSRPQNEGHYFAPGFSYMLRSTRLVPYLVPSGVVPTAGRAQIFPNDGEQYSVLGVCASNVGSAVARFSGEKFAWPKFQASMVQGLPGCDFSEQTQSMIQSHVDTQVNMRREQVQGYEPYQEFGVPAWLRHSESAETTWDLHTLFGGKIESAIADAYGLSEDQLTELERDIREAISIRSESDSGDPGADEPDPGAGAGGDELWVTLIEETPKLKAAGLIMYGMGAAFGRWDVRMASDLSLVPKLGEPFAVMPACPPGSLLGSDGNPARPGYIASEQWLRDRPNASCIPDADAEDTSVIADEQYEMPVAWSGILPDDPGSMQDIGKRILRALGMMLRDPETEETQVWRLLGVSDVHAYLRRTSGFFAEHLKAYSKNRRYAPIYWPIATATGSYTLWLYYHRLTDQTLYTCVNDFVEPKLKQVSDEAGQLRGKSNRSSAEEKELERLSDLELELKDFRDELLRIAQFWKPNLNDGVQITAAPLWKLFQHRQWQSRLKETWEKLEAGEYDWAHLALSIWPDRVVRACHNDRSYAIAHDLENELWAEVEVEKRTRGGKVKKVMEWHARDLSDFDLARIAQNSTMPKCSAAGVE